MKKIDDYGLLPSKNCGIKKDRNKQNNPIVVISSRNDGPRCRPKSSDSKMSQRRGLKLSKTLESSEVSFNLRQKTLPCFPLHMHESQNIRRKQIKIEYFNSDVKSKRKYQITWSIKTIFQLESTTQLKSLSSQPPKVFQTETLAQLSFGEQIVLFKQVLENRFSKSHIPRHNILGDPSQINQNNFDIRHSILSFSIDYYTLIYYSLFLFIRIFQICPAIYDQGHSFRNLQIFFLYSLNSIYNLKFIQFNNSMKDNKAARYKRGLTIINLIQTNAGYSIIQGTQLLNKVNNQVSISTSGPPPNPSIYPAPIPVFKQPIKMAVKHNNLVFLKSPTYVNDKLDMGDKKNSSKLTPQPKVPYAQWFNFNEISQFQKSEVKSWIAEWNSSKNTNQFVFNTYLQKYKHHRNIIIEIYYKNFAPSKSYMSASSVRKYICEDAKWLMKIHLLLTSWGIINFNKINFQNENFHASSIMKITEQGKYDVLILDSYLNSKSDKNNLKQADNDSYLKLKKVTNGIRPYCDYCGIHCEIVWFQHIRAIDPKQISTIMKNVNSKNPPLSEKQYEIILCTKCYCNGNFPLLLTHHDFRKITVNDRLEPGKKKKTSKNKRKQKKHKLKQKQNLLEEQEEFKQQAQQAQEDFANKLEKEKEKQKEGEGQKQKEKQTEKNKEKDEENENEYSKESGHIKDRKQSQVNLNLNGTKEVKQNKSNNNNDIHLLTQAQKQASVNEIIQEIVKSVKDQRVWTFEQTYKLLQLVEEYSDDWDAVHKSMNNLGFCKDCQPQDLILHFIKLPQLNISELIQQNSNQCFVHLNKQEYKSDFLTKKIQKNFDNCVKMSYILDQKDQKAENPKRKNWKQLLNRFVELNIGKINSKIELLNEINLKSLRQHRNYQKAYKEIDL